MKGLNKIVNRNMRFKMNDVPSHDEDDEDVEIFVDGMTRSEWMIMQPEYVELSRKMMAIIVEKNENAKS